MEIELSIGKIILKSPTAGARNQALMKAETADGIKNTVMMVELLPHCVSTHPFGAKPLRQALDNLSCEDYDKLVVGLTTLMKPKDDELKKKLETPSEEVPLEKVE